MSWPTEVLQLYLAESEAFQQVVKRHVEFLQEYVHLDSMDCSAMRDQQSPDQWLEGVCAQRRVIVYVSPQLMAGLHSNSAGGRQGAAAACNTMASKCAEVIHRLTTTDALKKGRGKRRNPIFILSGGFQSDADDEKYLSQHSSLRCQQRYWISRRGVPGLTAPGPLLTKLGGCHHGFSTGHWHNSPKVPELIAAVDRLGGYGCYVHLEGQAETAPMLCDAESDMTEHTYVSLQGGGGPRDREGPGPHRTDSGFSSAMDHNRGSNPSSEGNSSPGANVGEGLMEEDCSETHPMMHRFQGPFSASQTSLYFYPPESEVGDADSYVLTEEMKRINARGDWSQCPAGDC